MFRGTVTLITPAVALAVNDYTLVTTGKVCPDSSRLPLPCGNCGPNWGELQDCEDVCNAMEKCSHITYYEDKGCRTYSACDVETSDLQGPQVQTDIYKRNNPKVVTRPEGPCDILAAAGKPCVAAHSVVRALYANYTGALYRVLRDSDKAGLDIFVRPTGVAKIESQDAFCQGTSCYILRIYDQSPQGNDLDTSPPGGACNKPLSPVNATREQIKIGGHTVYGAYFEGNMGYRRDKTSGVATGETEQTMYMVTRGDHVNAGCCFDYGNAETNNLDDGQGTMEAVYFGTSQGWGHGQGDGPWVMADLENGLWAGSDRAASAPSVTHTFVTAMVKGRKGGFALKGGNAIEGPLQSLYDGPRPAGYETMKKQGSIILGIGGDNSCSAIGTFYEGAMTASFTTDDTDNAVQANIVAAGYGTSSTVIV